MSHPRLARQAAEHPSRHFAVSLAAVALLGVLIRLVYVQVLGPHARLYNDSGWYFANGANLLHGDGYLDVGRQFAFQTGHWSATTRRPSAFWPPGYPVFLAGVDWLLGVSWYVARMAGIATGAATIVVTGLLGRAVAGRAVELLAAGFVALSPLLIAVDGSLMTIQHRGVSYALRHADRWPLVVPGRVARAWGLWDPLDEARREQIESRNYHWQILAWAVSLVTLALGLAGIRLLARRHHHVAMLVAPLVMTTVLVAVTYGNTRFRAPAECALAIGAVAAVITVWRNLAAARTPPPPWSATDDLVASAPRAVAPPGGS